MEIQFSTLFSLKFLMNVSQKTTTKNNNNNNW